MSKQKQPLEITTILDADGDAYIFTLSAHYTETPRYTVDIRRNDNGSDCGFAVDPYSLQQLTARFAKAVLRISKSAATKSIRIHNATGGGDVIFALSADPPETPRYELNINVLGPSGDDILMVIDPEGLQELTAWFAKAVVRVSRYESDHSDS